MANLPTEQCGETVGNLRCALPKGHDGFHDDGNDPDAPIVEAPVSSKTSVDLDWLRRAADSLAFGPTTKALLTPYIDEIERLQRDLEIATFERNQTERDLNSAQDMADLSDRRLPCDVRLPPATTLKKGLRVRTLITALNVRQKILDRGEQLPSFADLPVETPAPASKQLVMTPSEIAQFIADCRTLIKHSRTFYEVRDALSKAIWLIESTAHETGCDADILRCLKRNPDEFASAVEDAYQRWRPSENEFSELLADEVQHQLQCSGKVPALKTPAPQPSSEDDETPCPIREDGMHCECWYGGNTCCGCGDGDRKLGGGAYPTCAEIRAEKTPAEPPATSMDYGGVGQVGCEGEDGLLRIHTADQTCDVCSSGNGTEGKL